MLRAGRPAVTEESIAGGTGEQVFLTTHRPVRIAERNLLLSSSADISAQKAFEDQLFRSAYYDELTDLPIRRVIEHRANSLMQHHTSRPASRWPFSTSKFQAHQRLLRSSVGDALLVEIAKALGLDLRETDMLSRISGDEFLLLLAPIDGEEAGGGIYRRHVATAESAVLHRWIGNIRLDVDRRQPVIPNMAAVTSSCCQNADIAMYRVKSGGKGAAAFFDASMEREALARMKVEQSLRHAILEKRFCCAFQPKVDIRTKAIKGIEALVRLRDDDGVIQAPGTFINLAAELGLIDELTHLVLAEIVQIDRPHQRTFGARTTRSA